MGTGKEGRAPDAGVKRITTRVFPAGPLPFRSKAGTRQGYCRRPAMSSTPEELDRYIMACSFHHSTQHSAYQKFRTTAVSKNMPSHILMLLDFAFIVIAGKESDAIACLDDIKKRLQVKHHYYTLIEYIVGDIYSDDEKKSKKAKKVFLDSVDQYCLKLLKIKEW